MKKLRSKWPKEFKCKKLPSKKNSDTCIRSVIEPPRGERMNHMFCTPNTLPLCQNMTFTSGSLPNMFRQGSVDEIGQEMEFYRPLIDSACSPQLPFFLCGTYMPFCIRTEDPLAMPCRELCEMVKAECSDDFRRLYGGLPWPQKLQCHLYPESSGQRRCVMHTDNELLPLHISESGASDET